MKKAFKGKLKRSKKDIIGFFLIHYLSDIGLGYGSMEAQWEIACFL